VGPGLGRAGGRPARQRRRGAAGDMGRVLRAVRGALGARHARRGHGPAQVRRARRATRAGRRRPAASRRARRALFREAFHSGGGSRQAARARRVCAAIADELPRLFVRPGRGARRWRAAAPSCLAACRATARSRAGAAQHRASRSAGSARSAWRSTATAPARPPTTVRKRARRGRAVVNCADCAALLRTCVCACLLMQHVCRAHVQGGSAPSSAARRASRRTGARARCAARWRHAQRLWHGATQHVSRRVLSC
jgi:hypothetical protein